MSRGKRIEMMRLWSGWILSASAVLIMGTSALGPVFADEGSSGADEQREGSVSGVEVFVGDNGTVNGHEEDYEEEIIPGKDVDLVLEAEDGYVIDSVMVNHEELAPEDQEGLIGETKGELPLESPEGDISVEALFRAAEAEAEVTGTDEADDTDETAGTDEAADTDETAGTDEAADTDETAGNDEAGEDEEGIDTAIEDGTDEAEDTGETEDSTEGEDSAEAGDTEEAEGTAEGAEDEEAGDPDETDKSGDAEEAAEGSDDETGSADESGGTSDTGSAEAAETGESESEPELFELEAEEEQEEGNEGEDTEETDGAADWTPRTGDQLPLTVILVMAASLTMIGIAACRLLYRRIRRTRS